jgi:hypothetical protein
MSHFTVLIAVDADGPDDVEAKVEQALAPYDENITVEGYWTDEAESFEGWWDRKYHIDEGHIAPDATFEDLLAYLKDDEEYEEERYRLTEDGKVERLTTYNPKSKWDWYQIGGRWTGSLRLKQSVHATPDAGRGSPSWGEPPVLEDRDVDYARKGDLDIEGVRAEAEQQAEVTWAAVQLIVDQHGWPKPFADFIKDSGYDTLPDKSTDEAKALIQKVRDDYHGQPAIVAAKEAGLLQDFFSSWDDSFGGFTRETYVRYHRNSAVGGFAFLGGEVGWMEPGRMGWFGMSSDENEDRIAYADKLAAIIDLIPDSEYLVMVDCHI